MSKMIANLMSIIKNGKMTCFVNQNQWNISSIDIHLYIIDIIKGNQIIIIKLRSSISKN